MLFSSSTIGIKQKIICTTESQRAQSRAEASYDLISSVASVTLW